MTNKKSKRINEPDTLPRFEGRIKWVGYCYENGTNAALRKRYFAILLELEKQREARFGIPAPPREFDRRRSPSPHRFNAEHAELRIASHQLHVLGE